MKKMKILLAICFLGAVFCMDLSAKPVVLDRIVAIVNDEIITLADLERFKEIMYMDAEQKPSGPQVNMQLLNQMVEKRLILQEAKVLEIVVTEVQLKSAMDDVVKRSNTTLEHFKEMIKKSGVSFEEYSDLLKTELIQSQVVSQRVQAKIGISDEEAEAYYEAEIKPDEKPGERVRVQQILFAVPKEASLEDVAAIEKQAAAVHESLLEGESFGKMAVAYSQGPAAKTGGDLGYFHRGEILPEIEKAAFSMDVGETSPVIRTMIGFHILKLRDKDLTEKDRSWKDHDRDIKNILYGRKYEETFKSWMDGLKKKAYIKINY